MRTGSTLFFKIYATMAVTLIVVALASALYVHFGDAELDRGWAGRRDAILTAMIPANDAPGELRAALGRLGPVFDADITVFDAGGRPLAHIGAPIAAPPPDAPRWIERARPRQYYTVRLADGRTVAARFNRTFGPGEGRRNSFRYLLLIAVVTGLAAFPFVRHLTRRLEALRVGMNAWGSGDLSRRVPVEGGDEVATVAKAFNQAAERIERMVKANRALLANASHELRSPLARLRMAADVPAGQADPARRAEIVRNLAELDGLVEEILLASRLDHIQGLERRETVDLLAVVAEEAARHGAEVEGRSTTVEGDPLLILRLVRNLLQNAARHGQPPVSVAVGEVGGAAELSVRDHGPGIPAGESERVFEPFYRPSGRGETAGGWGLGLSLVRQIAAHHGASVRYEAPGGGGSRFVVRFDNQSPRLRQRSTARW